MNTPTLSVRKTISLVRRDLRAADGQASYGYGWLSRSAQEALGVQGLEVRHAAGSGGILLGVFLVVGSIPATAGRRPIAV
jgi:hypothetical protein